MSKYCVDCRHSSKFGDYFMCGKVWSIDLVTGKREFQTNSMCTVQRYSIGCGECCGESAKWFEEKEIAVQ